MQATTMCVSPIAPEAACAAQAAGRLTVLKATALRHLKARMQQGVAIRRRSLRYMEDLEEARVAKAQWVQLCGEMLRQMFQGDAGPAAAERFNDWVGRVFPDYAEMELFAGQFYEEMDHRLTRLRDVAREVVEMPEQVSLPPRPVSVTPPAMTSVQPALEAGGAPNVAILEAAPPIAPTTVAVFATPEPEAPEIKPAPGGLLLVHHCPEGRVAGVQALLEMLGISVRVIQANSQDATAATAALEQHRDAASFAAVLLGGDEGAAPVPGALASVTFQLGYLAGRLGAARVCILHPGPDAEPTAEPFGIRCLSLDAGNGWHLQLARHLKKAGIEVDLNKLC